MTSIIDVQNHKTTKDNGKLIVRCQKVEDSNCIFLFYVEYFQMKWSALKLTNTDSFFDFWDKSDPYLKFLKIRDDNTYV